MIKRTLSLISIISIGVIIYAQDIKVPINSLRQIKEKDLAKNMRVLVSDSLEGRATGKPGATKAANYIVGYFKSLGLQPYKNDSYLQPFELWKKERMPFTIKVRDTTINSETDIFYLGNVPQNDCIDREIVYVGDGNDSLTANLDLKGKIALVSFEDMSRTVSINMELEKQGAWAIWGFNSRDSDQFKRIHDSYSNFYRNMPLSNTKPRQTEKGTRFFILSNKCISSLTGFTAAQLTDLPSDQWIKSPITSQVNLSFPIQIMPVEGWNVIGILKGEGDNSKSIAITAHYDHMGRQEDDSILYGADDNASGVSTMMELAQTYTSLKEKPKHNLMFVAFGAEELGLLGSAYFMSQADKNQFFANINIDMIARRDTATKDNYVYILGTDKSTNLQTICEKANDQSVQLKIDDAYNHSSGFGSFMNRSDHFQFFKNGIPVISFFSGLHNDYHTPRDTMDKIDFELWEKRVKLIFSTLYILDQQQALK